MKNINAPIKGHTLLREGHIQPRWQRTPVGEAQRWTADGGCRCGYMPIDWRSMSITKVKAWHRAHKEDVRNKRKPEVIGLYPVVASTPSYGND